MLVISCVLCVRKRNSRGVNLEFSKQQLPHLNRFRITVGTKIIADPENSFQELIFKNLLNLLWDWPCLEIIIVCSNFQDLLFLQDRSLESV